MVEQGEKERASEDLKIGFLTVRAVDKQTYRAGLLVTDAEGKPLEVRATAEALCPTLIQSILYGASLIPTIADLCGAPLIQALREHPDLILVDQPAFLELHTAERPVVYVARTGEELEIDAASEDSATEETLQAPSGRFQPVVLRFGQRVHAGTARSVRAKLSSLFTRFDLVEPFERVAKSLKVLHDQSSTQAT